MQAMETACGRKRLELTLTPVTFGGKKLELGAETGFDIRYLGEKDAGCIEGLATRSQLAVGS